MNKTLESRHHSHKVVLLSLEKYKEKVALVPVMAQSVEELKSNIEKTVALITKVKSLPVKTAANKKVARAELAAIALKISNILKVYAVILKDENLASTLETTETALSTQLRHQQLLDYCKNLLELLNSMGETLTPYGLTPELKSQLEEEVEDFKTTFSEPRQLITERKTNNELIGELIGDATEILSDKIDPLMELFNEDKEFYLEYKSARMIVDPATRKRTEELIQN
ncbi:hypothetical protein [Carboxylicivirga sp. M1479]|uniref:hypothetical protein n=1 Tax=Carboxylicivirga sp. M1479 TaxID=2594476 RepID=UPI001178180B|nr:hypothetical protein [Carboxylicivirga sp. M1479]TRX71714.1 hypothetical protein FNN09_05605 [Carboxylicivirga sp. M1479]